jgi:hypothetical protein
MKLNSFLNLLKTLLEIIIIYYILFNMKRIKNLRWLYYFFLTMFTLIFAIWSPTIVYVIFGLSDSLGNIFNLPWHFYISIALTFIVSFFTVDYLVNIGLRSTGFQNMAVFTLKDFSIGILLVILLFYFGTGGISEMKRRDQIYRDNVQGNF